MTEVPSSSTEKDEAHCTDSWIEQHEVEERIFLIRDANGPDRPLVLLREKHVSWLMRCLEHLPKGFQILDALQGWAAFWILHSLDLLGATIPPDISTQLVEYLASFQDVSGGYGGGPQQSGHVASTFSVFMALCVLGTNQALASIDCTALASFILEMKQEDGSFKVSDGGESDVRATYCGLSVASILGLLDGEKGLKYTYGCAKYIKSLQAFDGGLGGEPGSEAHGGNTYCGLASLVILEERDAIDVEKLLDWAVMRQMSYEGGFQGRTNKLVDSCYSFWVGSLFPLLASLQQSMNIAEMFDAAALQRYVLECCQLENGGLRDKPGTARDFMHTCYALSGVAVAQHFGGADVEAGNELRRTTPVYNLCMDKFTKARKYFRDT